MPIAEIKPGQIWDQKQTAAMRTDQATRSVVVIGHAPDWRGDKTLTIGPAPGQRGRTTHITVASFLRKFTLRPASGLSTTSPS